MAFPARYIVPIQLKSNAQARLSRYNVEITSDDVGLPQNEKEEMKELLKSGWHHVNVIFNKIKECQTKISLLDVSFSKRNIQYFAISTG